MDRYEKLREILHTHPAGAPKSKTFGEILRILFTPEEVEVALGLVFVPRNVQEIAKAARAVVPFSEASPNSITQTPLRKADGTLRSIPICAMDAESVKIIDAL